MADWLLEAAKAYNRDSYDQRDRYATHLLIPLETMRTVIRWSMESIPDEVLIGFDPNPERPNPDPVEEVFGPPQSTFSGSGFLLGVCSSDLGSQVFWRMLRTRGGGSSALVRVHQCRSHT